MPCLLAATVLLAVGCTSRSLNRAPVEDRGTGISRSLPGAVDSGVAKQLPGFENAGKPGYYTVKPGDTMIRIGLDHGQNWRDIVRWNNLENPNVIEVGQVLRVVPPAAESPLVVARPVSAGAADTGTALPAQQAASAARPATAPAGASPSSNGSEEELTWSWPAQGTLLAGFDEAKNKGFDIAGKAGDAIVASADGRVVYAGAGLRGYGNLIILKHNNTYLTAYAHNQTLLVKEDQSVKKGQKIAEMGSSDSEGGRVKLHFEIRRQGKPVDPAKFLPAR
ncbi:peptidoglycan DD-metalloendopeptidase family protein [Polaromonas sp.]|uniref:peptidoglycan DD-metalloendopeptidase family protein n=1 Tax=Polaromonas sp. TaxID=1869339 RepID=UPI002FC5DFEB